MIFGAARPRAPRNSARAARRPPPGIQEPLPPKLIPALRALASTGASLLHTRLALAGIELEEEMQRLMSAAVLGVVAMVFGLLGIIVGTFTIVAAVPPEYRVATMIAITVLYLAIAVVSVLRVKGIFTNRPAIFAATLAELEKDKETWSQINRAHREAEEAHERAQENRAASASTTAQGVH
jgi:uncharacterized membrane protein YqjE